MPENSKETFKNRLKRYAEISNVGEISRRYFVMNAFDGALTMLGVVIGSYISNTRSSYPIISAGIVGSWAIHVKIFCIECYKDCEDDK